MKLQKLSATQIQNNSLSDSKKAENKEAKQEQTQLKEHCSSKAAKALKGMALGLALAAGVAAGSKMTAEAKTVSVNIPENATNITVQYEVSDEVEKTEVEEAVDKAISENDEKQSNPAAAVLCVGATACSAGVLFLVDDNKQYKY